MTFILKFLVNIQKLPDNGLAINLEATDQELKVIKQNYDLLDITFLKGDYRLIPEKNHNLRLRGILSAEVKQECVASLRPIVNNINETIDIIYIKNHKRNIKEIQISIDNEGDFYETYEGNKIDIGAITEEIFALNLDPYPRYKEIEPIVFSTDSENENKHPFAILKKLK